MSLFSWFSKKNNATKNCPEAIEQELNNFNNTSMWPIAKARKTTFVKQQQFINEKNNKNANEAKTELHDKTV